MFKNKLAGYNRLYDKLYNIGLKEIEEIARQHLKDNPKLGKFYMGMGSYHFENVKKEWTDEIPCKRLDEFMFEYDTEWKFTGSPMSFTAEGKNIRDW